MVACRKANRVLGPRLMVDPSGIVEGSPDLFGDVHQKDSLTKAGAETQAAAASLGRHELVYARC